MAINNALGQDGGTGTQVLMSTGGTTAPSFQGAGNAAISFISGSTYSTIQEMNDTFHSAGLLAPGNIISDGGSGTVDLTQCEIAIRVSDSAVAELTMATVAASSGVALTDNNLNYIYIEYNAGTPQFVVTTTERTDYNTNVDLGTVYRYGTDLHITNQKQILVGDHGSLMVRRAIETNTFARVSGEITSETGTRNIAITTGVFWEGLTRFTIASVDTSAAGTFSYYYSDGASGFTEVTAQTQIDNTQYDDGSGTLAALGTNKYGVHWVYRGVDGDTYCLYGLGSYSVSQAVDVGSPASVPPHFEGHAMLIAKIIIQKSASTFYDLSTPFDTTLTTTGVTAHADLSGLSADDHPQYLLADGTRALAGAWDMGSQNLTNVNIDSGVITGITDLAVADGGTGRSSHTEYAVLCGGTTTTAAQQSIASVGTSGQVLTSNGAAALPTFQAASTGDVTAAANMTDNTIVKGDGGAKGVQDSGISISDLDAITGITSLTVDDIVIDGGTIQGTAASALNIAPTAGQVLQLDGSTTTVDNGAIVTTSINFGDEDLDTYDEGTFTATLTGSTGAPSTMTYTNQEGYYVRTGNMCWYHYRMAVNVRTGGTGNAVFGGLPFTVFSSQTLYQGAPLIQSSNIPASVIYVVHYTAASTTTMQYRNVFDTSADTVYALGNIVNGDGHRMSGQYQI